MTEKLAKLSVGRISIAWNRETYCNGDSEPFSAIARIALSNGVCTLAQARSNSVRLCAHFDAINSRPPLQNVYEFMIRDFRNANRSLAQRDDNMARRPSRHIIISLPSISMQKRTRYHALPNSQTEINVSSPMWATESDCHVSALHNPEHPTIVVLYSFSGFFE